ncbi:hypothetical protein ACWOAH_01560 [Vagococcus vulneris]|uniref:Uncharacterized protein n=1 Tax=Vagococcus vulneris TaxID=1977869 RepID=A0A430A1I2_9ENTE|nr:hypothetical protein [Vagococcus vulneris]RSU00240.1 hypothetical protein CBF37_02785 [Vagococcus vulneris]
MTQYKKEVLEKEARVLKGSIWELNQDIKCLEEELILKKKQKVKYMQLLNNKQLDLEELE